MRSWVLVGLLAASIAAGAQKRLPATVEIGEGWKLQDAARVKDSGEQISSPGFRAEAWNRAVVPGTALTSLVADGLYSEPFYGENNRTIPESLARTSWWYRTVMTVPRAYAGHRVWLNFDGINYAAEIWVNGVRAGTTRGAFVRGVFDITGYVKPGGRAAIAVKVDPQPHPGVPHEHTVKAGMGLNGGETAIDGPTFLATIGWDWLPAIRDRDTGIWQHVSLSATGDVLIKDPQVTTSLPLPRTDEASVTVRATVENVSKEAQRGVLRGEIEGITVEKPVELAAGESKIVSFDPTTDAALKMEKPRLWWPNGYGPQNLYRLKLTFVEEKNTRVSDVHELNFGVRQIGYGEGSNLAISVNGVKVFVRGGDWGMEEGMKRESPARMEAQMHLHALANLNMIRNWVGQSTSELFYEMADKYGLMLWDEFFQPNPSDGPNPEDVPTYLANVREKVLRYRNHPSIVLWCGRNEGPPPPEINTALKAMMAELDPARLYQPSSTDGRGVRSSGPYRWRTPREFYHWKDDEAFKTEIGSVSVPTLESIQGMMPEKDWKTVNDDWAEHDLAKGASGGDTYKAVMEKRYGEVKDIVDFARKGQMMNVESFRAMYEGRNARMWAAEGLTATGVITWMSNPAQPSFVWQLYHYDLEPNAALFAVKSAAESVHVQLNEDTDDVEVVNNAPVAFTGQVVARVFALDGSKLNEVSLPLDVAASWESDYKKIDIPEEGAEVRFVALELHDATGALVSRNLYWRGAGEHGDDLRAMDSMAKVKLTVTASRKDEEDKTTVTLQLKNPTTHIALMAHLQLRRSDGSRVLPVFYRDNYLSLLPGEERSVEIEAETKQLQGKNAVVVVDGWNVEAAPSTSKGVSVR